MRISQLRSFATIAQLENLSQAAEYLHVSQSSLSKSLALLEEEMGASLFTRNGRKLILNAAGARMQEFSLMVLQELEYAKDDIRLLSTGAEVRLKIGTAGGIDRLSECIAAFRKEHPGTEFELSGNIEGEEYLDINEYDMLIYPDGREYEKYTGYPLYEEHYLLAVPAEHPLAGLPLVRLRALSGQDVIFLRTGRNRVEYPFRICGALALTFSSQIFADSREIHRQLIAEGVGVGFAASGSASFYRNEPGIRLIPVQDQKLTRKMMVCFRKDKYLSVTAKMFKGFVLNFFHVQNEQLHNKQLQNEQLQNEQIIH